MVKGIVWAEVLVETDADGIVTYDDALVQGTNLGIDLRGLQAMDIIPQVFEGIGQLLIDVIHVCILLFCLCNEGLKRWVLIESEELGVDLLVVNLSNTQYILNQCTGLHRINGIHLL